MTSLVLRLKGPLQAWSTESRMSIRRTDDTPSKSGVLGLLAAALGMERSDDATLAKLADLELAIRVDHPGTLLRDYQTAGSGRFRGGDYYVAGTKACVTSERYYLQGASFLAALSGDDEWIELLAGALKAPKWPLFLGRRSCPPSTPVLVGVEDGNASDVVRHADLEDERAPDGDRRLLIEVSPEEGGEARRDVPISFAPGRRRYRLRYVRSEWLVMSAQKEAV